MKKRKKEEKVQMFKVMYQHSIRYDHIGIVPDRNILSFISQ